MANFFSAKFRKKVYQIVKDSGFRVISERVCYHQVIEQSFYFRSDLCTSWFYKPQ